MHRRDSIEEHIPVDAGKAEEILVLAPASGAPFVHLHRQAVLALFDEGCQGKFRGSERIFTVSHILPVKPEGKGALHALERDVERKVLHPFGQRKDFHVGSRRIEPLRDLPRLHFLTPVPGILGIHIGRRIVAFHLDVGRHRDIIPRAAVEGWIFKALRRTLKIDGIGKLPAPV